MKSGRLTQQEIRGSLSLYVMTTYDLTGDVLFPVNQLVDTPWQLCYDSFVLAMMIPLTFFSVRIVPSFIAIAWLFGLYAFNWWIILGDDLEVDSMDTIRSRIDKIYDAFDVTAYSGDSAKDDLLDTSDMVYKYLTYMAGLNIFVLIPGTFFLFFVDLYNYRGESQNDLMKERVMWEDRYVKELLTTVPRGMKAPQWTNRISPPKSTIYGRFFETPYGVELRWSPPQKYAASVGSYRIVQISQHVGGGQIVSEKIICEDTKKVWKQRGRRRSDTRKEGPVEGNINSTNVEGTTSSSPFACQYRLSIVLTVLIIGMEIIAAIYSAQHLRDSLNKNNDILVTSTNRVNTLVSKLSNDDGTLHQYAADIYANADVVADTLLFAAAAGSLATICFLHSFYVGVIQKIRLFREGKKVRNFRSLDVQRTFGVNVQAQFIGAIFSFYVIGNAINVFLWFTIAIHFTYDELFQNVTKPIIEWTIFYTLACYFNGLMETYVFNKIIADPNFFFWFKDSNMYFIIDFVLLLYYIPYMGVSVVLKIANSFLMVIGLIFRMDLTNYDEGTEDFDFGFATTMALIAMNERCNNPVIQTFVRMITSATAKRKQSAERAGKEEEKEEENGERSKMTKIRVAPNSIRVQSFDDIISGGNDVAPSQMLRDESAAGEKVEKDKVVPSLRTQSSDDGEDDDDEDAPKHILPTKATTRALSSIRARTRWHLAYTLIQNPHLVKFRKKYRATSSAILLHARSPSAMGFASKIEEDPRDSSPSQLSVDGLSTSKGDAKAAPTREKVTVNPRRIFERRERSSFTAVEMRRGWSPQRNPKSSL
eukprot:g693.t1